MMDIFYITENTTEYKGKGEVTETPSVATETPRAEEISYTPEDTNWRVNNVKDAIDYLSDKNKRKEE